MNLAQRYIFANWERLGLSSLCPTSALSTFTVAPRFRKRVLFFVFCSGSAYPALIIKAGRVPGDPADELANEARNLDQAHKLLARNNRHGSIPRLVALDTFDGVKLMVQTALPADPLHNEFLKSQSAPYVEAVVDWLIDFHRRTLRHTSESEGWFDQLVERPLQRLWERIKGVPEQRLLAELMTSLQSLRGLQLPLVFCHGDFVRPNILRLEGDGIGVIDWEAAEYPGLPVADLLTFLISVATSDAAGRGERAYLEALEKTFFEPGSWARACIVKYMDALGIAKDLLTPLFLLTLTRYMSTRLETLPGERSRSNVGEDQALQWLTRNPYFWLWRHAATHADRFCFF